jgi:hypothetical protein
MNDQPSGSWLAEITAYVAHDLPHANVSCRDGILSLTEWIRSVLPVLADADCVASVRNPEQRLTMLQVLGFILASGERHAQACGHQPGWIVQQLPRLEHGVMMASCGRRAPVLTAELYWERNNGNPPLSFTGESHELFFISAVRTQVALRTVVNRQLRALADGGWHPADAEGARMLRAASAAMKEAHGQYLDFRRGPQGCPLMTPAQFNEMRLWLASTVVGGMTLAGANAAYIGEMVATDFLLGSADSVYDDYVRGFELYQPVAERRLIEADRARTPLVLILADALGLSSHEFDLSTVRELSERISHAAPALSWSLWAFKDLIDEFVGSSGAHVGLVHVYLEQYANELSPEQLARMPVKPTHGTGGHSHDHTKRLHDMRRKSSRIRKLLTALREARVDIVKSA